MRLISFDVGIKNMAYCIFDIFENNEGSRTLSIIDWNILNLMPVIETTIPLCNCILDSKKTKKKPMMENQDPPKTCNKKAKYKKEASFFCEKHAQSSSFIIETHATQRSEVEGSIILPNLRRYKKMNMDQLKQLCNQYMLTYKPSKKELLDCIQEFIHKKVLEPIKLETNKTAGETDLITIGRNMTKLLNENIFINDINNRITHVIIENQISPLANRMKTIQGMLCQYFIMKESEPVIEFISSMNKLKGLSPGVPAVIEEKSPGLPGGNYKKNKADGILICSRFLQKNENLKKFM